LLSLWRLPRTYLQRPLLLRPWLLRKYRRRYWQHPDERNQNRKSK
jgi:hypothetical protein